MGESTQSVLSHVTNRRRFLQSGAAASALAMGGMPLRVWGAEEPRDGTSRSGQVIEPRADAMILIWMPGGIAQSDTWDPKEHTPFRAGMKGSELYSTCPSSPTSADGIVLGQGLETIGSMMHKGTIVRTLSSKTKFGAIHLKAQHYLMTGYEFPAGVKVPSFGSMVARTLGRRDKFVPAYIDIGRDINTSNEEYLFISNYQGPGFLGINSAPFMIPNPELGLPTLNVLASMTPDRVARRHNYLRAVTGLADPEVVEAEKSKDYMQVMEDAYAMMDSPVKRAFNLKEEKPETLAAYDVGHRFGPACLLARRLVEVGARFVEVEYQYAPFKGFDMHEDASTRMVAMKQQVDRPIGMMLRELDERGLLDRTLVVIATEFGRTIADKPAAGTEAFGFDEAQTGENLEIESEKQYGHHGHFSSASCMLFFGGGFKQGFVYGKTNERHPMEPIENPVVLTDLHATIYKALGIAPDTFYTTEQRPFYVTKDGLGKPIEALLA